jgi:hypothetical protein
LYGILEAEDIYLSLSIARLSHLSSDVHVDQ